MTYASRTRGSRFHPSGSQPYSFCLPFRPPTRENPRLVSSPSWSKNYLTFRNNYFLKTQNSKDCSQVGERALDFDLILNGHSANYARLGRSNVACFGQIWPKVGKSPQMSLKVVKFETKMSGFFKGPLEKKFKIQMQSWKVFSLV